MGKLPRSTTAAVFAGSAIGVVITLASGELVERVAANESEIAALRQELAAASKPPTTSPTTKPPSQPPSSVEQEVKDKLEFRKAVLKALEPELEAIDARAEAIETKAAAAKKTFDEHHHEIEEASHGWVKLDVMLASDHLEVVRAPYRNDWVAVRDSKTTGMSTKTTSKPK